MVITLAFMNEWKTILGKENIEIEVFEPVSMEKVLELAREQLKDTDFDRELGSFMIIYNRRMLRIPQDLWVKIEPGEKLLFVPPIAGG